MGQLPSFDCLARAGCPKSVLCNCRDNCLIAAVLLAALFASAAPVKAEGWMFRGSYYSHQPAQGVQIGPRKVSGPIFTPPVGEYVRTGYRNINSRITVRGQHFEQINMWESWIQVGSQY
jgi:hypothetical protein